MAFDLGGFFNRNRGKIGAALGAIATAIASHAGVGDAIVAVVKVIIGQ